MQHTIIRSAFGALYLLAAVFLALQAGWLARDPKQVGRSLAMFVGSLCVYAVGLWVLP